MARIAGVDIPNAKRVEIALTYIYGIGLKSSQDILAKTGINPDTRAKDLTEEEIAERDKLRRIYIDSYKASLIGQLNNTYIVRPDGTKEKVTRK